ncbi:MAG: [FeFe] hydrogenase H-cluster radical SAM maturase HydE [Kiritimatiellia bacterium]
MSHAHSLHQKILTLLAAGTTGDRERIYRLADRVRQHWMGDTVFGRGIVEFTNHCANRCLYCGLRAPNARVRRYLMSSAEILAAARDIEQCGQTTIVLQSGETAAFGDRELGELVRNIKRQTALAVTLSVGNRPRETYRYWRECGMDRYLLRFETSDTALFTRLHPDCSLAARLQCLNDLREVGAQVGSGFMIGLPGETLETLADNILLCRRLDLDMIGIGPYIPHPDTPLAGAANVYDDRQEIFFLALAVLRVCNPRAHLPATTAYDAVFPGTGRNLALQRGANIFMPNNTPQPYRRDYLIYPGKPCLDETAGDCAHCLRRRLERLGRKLGAGPGHTIKSHPAS